MNNPRGTVKVAADVMTSCRSVQGRKAVLHVRAIRWSVSQYILLRPLPPPSSCSRGGISAAARKPGF